MEIFSNVWNILTTENEMVTKIFTIPTIPIEAWLGLLIIISILKIDISKKQKFLYVFFLTIISLITKFIIPSPYNIFFNYLCMYVEIKSIFKTNIVKTILCAIIPTILFALLGIIILKPLLILFRISSSQAQIIPIYELLYLSLLYLSILILLHIIKYKKLSLLLSQDFSPTNKKIITINLFLGFLTICVQLAITAFYTDILPVYISFFSFISLLAYFFISFYSLNKTMKLQITTENLQTAENYNETLSYLYDNVKAFKHDFDNMVFIIGGYIENNDINGLKTYYKNLEKDCERVNGLALLNPELINNSGIYNLLMSKYKKANDYKVEIHLEYFFDLQKLKMPIYEFSRILGILLDNALEAAKESNEKQVNILFRDSQRNHTQNITIKNSYNNKDVDTSTIFEKGTTSKPNHTGMGLWEVNQILGRNNNVNLITSKNEIFFKQSIEIYY